MTQTLKIESKQKSSKFNRFCCRHITSVAYLGNRLMAGLAGVAVVGDNVVDGDGGGNSHKSGGDNKGLKNVKIKWVNIKKIFQNILQNTGLR